MSQCRGKKPCFKLTSLTFFSVPPSASSWALPCTPSSSLRPGQVPALSQVCLLLVDLVVSPSTSTSSSGWDSSMTFRTPSQAAEKALTSQPSPALDFQLLYLHPTLLLLLPFLSKAICPPDPLPITPSSLSYPPSNFSLPQLIILPGLLLLNIMEQSRFFSRSRQGHAQSYLYFSSPYFQKLECSPHKTHTLRSH